MGKVNFMNFFRSLFVCSLFILANAAYAGHESTKLRISGSQMVAGGSVSQSDNKYPNVTVSGTAVVARSFSKITFGIDETNLSYYTPSTYSITVGLYLASNDASTAFQSLPSIVELTISYNQGTIYLDKGIYVINGSHSCSATIAYFKDANTGAIITSIPQNLFLEADVETERYYTLNTNFSSNPGAYVVNNQYISASNEIEISWQAIDGAEYYELEWTYVNDYYYNGSTFTTYPTSSLYFTFFNNATRIQTDQLKYRLSLIYERGYIFYRVRGVGRSLSDLTQYVYSDWSADPLNSFNIQASSFIGNTIYNNSSPTKSHYFYNSSTYDFESNKNWQYSASFAEEGKKKEVVSFFDGSLRNRQSVTRNSTDKIAVVGETFYDYQGRAAVQALPVPETNSSQLIKYFDYFNTSQATTVSGVHQPYSRVDFDQDPTGGGASCPPSAGAMYTNDLSTDATANGAAEYFSANNPNKDQMQAYLPDAQQYPFTHTIYTPDNTGRIRAQSGVGPDHKINSTHETKYLYTQPDQVELDRLFGSEAGFKYRYKKNVVIDANGQVSVNYLNSEGKTIATALAGDPPSNLSALSYTVPSTSTPLTETYFAYTQSDYDQLNLFDNNALTFTKPIVPSATTTYTFNYSLDVPQVHDNCLSICYDCVYDLEISIVDECNNVQYHSGPFNVGGVLSGSTYTVDFTCGGTIHFTNTGFTNPFSVSLPGGHSYTLLKTLTIDQTAFDAYTANYMNEVESGSTTCFKTQNDFTSAAMAGADLSGCNMTCAQCSTDLVAYHNLHKDSLKADPSSSTYDPTYVFLPYNQFQQMFDDCMGPCTPISLCHTQYQLMLADVTPNGQYAQYDVVVPSSGPTYYDASAYLLSIYNFPTPVTTGLANRNRLPETFIHSSTPSLQASWRNPKFYNLKKHDFVDNNGNTTTSTPVNIFHYYESDGQTLSTIALNVYPGSSPGTYYTVPEVLHQTFNTLNDITNTSDDIFTDPNTGTYYTYPERLSKLRDFVDNFNPYWSHSLVFYHPEFGYFGLCDDNEDASTSTYNSMTSEDFDNKIKGTETMADAQTNLTVTTGSGILDLLDQDPYFNGTGQGAGLYTTMKNFMLNYAFSGKTMKEVASFVVRCGTQYYNCSCSGNFGSTTFPSNVTTTAQQTKILDTEWKEYKSFYLSLKAKVQMDHFNFVAQNLYGSGTTNIGFFNAAIGNPNYYIWKYPNYFDPFHTGYGAFDSKQPSALGLSWMYSHKQQRFANDETFENLLANGATNPNDIANNLQNNAAQQLYLTTGQCPIAIKIQMLLDRMAKDNNLNNGSGSPIDLFFYGEFTQDLYDQVYTAAFTSAPPAVCSSSNTANNFLDFNWISTTSGNVVTATFSPAPPSTSSTPCTLTLFDPSGMGITWSWVKGMGNIKFTGTNTFNIDAYYDNDNNPATVDVVRTLVGSSCFTSTCPGNSSSSCTPNQTGHEVLQVLNALAAQPGGSGNSTLCSPVGTFDILNTSSYTSGFVTNLFKAPFSGAGSIIFTSTCGSGTITTPLLLSFAGGGYTVNMSMTYSNTVTSPNLGSVSYFSNLTPVSGNPNQFYLTANFSNGTSEPVIVNITYSPTNPHPFTLGNCNPPVAMMCNTPGYSTSIDMQAFLNELADNSISGNPNTLPSPSTSLNQHYDLSAYSNFTSMLQSYVNWQSSSYDMYLAASTANSITFNLGGTLTGTVLSSGCILSLTATNLTSFDFSTVDYFSDFAAVDAVPGSFTVTANVGSTEVAVTGQSSCMQFQNCEVCAATNPVFYEHFENYDSPLTYADLDFTNSYSSSFQAYNYCVSSTNGQWAIGEYHTVTCSVGTSGSLGRDHTVINPTGSPITTTNLNTLTTTVPRNYMIMWMNIPGNVTIIPPNIIWQKSVTLQQLTTYQFSAYFKCSGDGAHAVLWATDSHGNNYNVASGSLIAGLAVWKPVMGTLFTGTETTFTLYVGIDKTLNGGNMIGVDDIVLGIPGCPTGPPLTGVETPTTSTCEGQITNIATNNAQYAYQAYKDSVQGDFENRYLSTCSQSLESLTASYVDPEYHFTLYYYDQAGNLIKTVPPEGVEFLPLSSTMPNSSQTYQQAISQDRYSNTHTVFTTHRMATKYQYNSLNQLVLQNLPDHDEMNQWSLNATTSPPVNVNAAGMEFSSTSNGFMAGTDNNNSDNSSNGEILMTTDGGQSWTPVTTIGQKDLEDARFVNNTDGFVITDDGYLLSTNDAGTTWHEVNMPVTQAFTALTILPSGTGFIIGKGGTVLQTTNWGTSWSAASGFSSYNSIDFNEVKFAPDNTTGMIVGTGGTVLYTTNGGSTWAPANAPALNSNIECKDVVVESYTGTTYTATIAGADNSYTPPRGVVIKAQGTNLGITGEAWSWSTQYTNGSTTANTTLKTIVKTLQGSNNIYYAGGKGGLMVANNPAANTTWTVVTSGTTADITELDVISPSTSNSVIFGSLSNGKLLAYNFYGSGWSEGSTSNTMPLNGVYYNVSASTGYLVGDGGTVIRFIGTTFTPLTQFLLPKMNGVAVSHSGTTPYIYAMGNSGTLVYSSTGGASWQYLPSTINNDLNAGYFDAPTSGVLVGTGATAYVNGSLSNPVVNAVTFPSSASSLRDVARSVGGNYYACGSGSSSAGVILSSANGTSWNNTPVHTSSSILNAIMFSDANSGFVVGNGGYFASTTDGGATWTSQTTGVTVDLHDVYFSDKETGYAVGDNNTIIKTIDGGLNWVAQPGTIGSNTDNYGAVAFTASGHAVVAGSAGAANVVTLNDQTDDHSSRFFYDELGRLIISQNTKQFNRTPQAYSYTKYDALGRITEVGEVTNGTDPQIYVSGQNNVLNYSYYIYVWLPAGTPSEVTTTVYDEPVTTSCSFAQDNLRKRISATYIDADGNLSNGFDHATYYTYDDHGNVTSIMNENPALYVSSASRQCTRIDYSYDLVSGKVNEVAFQQGQSDAFYYKYEYDADNRIVAVYTSREGVTWERDAKYFYYQHGPLARVEIGDQKVQGMDYAYTLQGWIKGINSTTLSQTNDIGKDASTSSSTSLYYSVAGNIHQYTGQDVYSYSLNYYDNDYQAIETTNKYSSANRFDADVTANPNTTGSNQLFNGNIMAMATTIINADPSSGGFRGAMPQLASFKYDQLNRINMMKTYGDLATNAWGNGSVFIPNEYKNTFTYDMNGNIENQVRYNAAGQKIDDMTYQYEIENGKKTRNRLYHVNDAASSSLSTVDIDDQGSFTQVQPNNEGIINTANNYGYDELGQLVRDDQEEIASIEWTVYGKIKQITRTSSSTKSNLQFAYDAAGNRICKTEIPKTPHSGNRTTYYLRDAQGNVLATYVAEPGPVDIPILKNSEYDVYGSSRVGLLQEGVDISTLPALAPPTESIDNGSVVPSAINSTLATYSYNHTRGQRMYEMGNHLGNVSTVVTDKKIPHSTSGTTIDYFYADAISTTDYYPFGSVMNGRNYNAPNYKYSINGQEKTDEISGSGNHTTALFWEYDTRLGRRWNLDPKPTVGVSDYSAFNNNPILQTDVNGDKPTPKQAAAIASHVYGDKSDKILKGGWKVSKRDFGIQKNDEKTGLHSEIYERTHKGKTEYVYATAGTEDATDAKQDALQPLGLSSQYEQATTNAMKISNELGKGTELTFTGHSLGGGEAAANAYATGRDAITFNAAGVGPLTLIKNPYNSKAKIDAYILLTDPLNAAQNASSTDILPDVNGTRHYKLPQDWPSIYNGHSMDNVLKCFEINPTNYKK